MVSELSGPVAETTGCLDPIALKSPCLRIWTRETEKQIESGNAVWQTTHMNTDWTNCPVVEHEPGKVSGAWVFRGTRVPVHALFENIEGGASVDDFLEWFPGVTRQQVDVVLEYVSADLLVATPA